jgi:hypothetical protein
MRYWRAVVLALVCSALTILGGALFAHWRRLPFSQGEMGRYGVIELGLPSETRILEFSAQQRPGQLAVRIRYRDASGIEQQWQRWYTIACDVHGNCVPIETLRGVGLFDAQGKLFDEHGWVYFLRVRAWRR